VSVDYIIESLLQSLFSAAAELSKWEHFQVKTQLSSASWNTSYTRCL